MIRCSNYSIILFLMMMDGLCIAQISNNEIYPELPPPPPPSEIANEIVQSPKLLTEGVYKLAITNNEKRQYGCINAKGKVIIDCLYDEIVLSKDQKYILATAGHTTTIFNNKGFLIYEKEGRKIVELNCGNYKMTEKETYGMVRIGLTKNLENLGELKYAQLKKVAPNCYKVREYLPEKSKAGWWLTSGLGLINQEGTVLLPCKYRDIVYVNKDLIFARDETIPVYSIFDISGKQKSEMTFNNLYYLNNKQLIVLEDLYTRKLGLMNADGEVSKFIFDKFDAHYYHPQNQFEGIVMLENNQPVKIDENFQRLGLTKKDSTRLKAYVKTILESRNFLNLIHPLEKQLTENWIKNAYQFSEIKGQNCVIKYEFFTKNRGRRTIIFFPGTKGKEMVEQDFTYVLSLRGDQNPVTSWLWLKYDATPENTRVSAFFKDFQNTEIFKKKDVIRLHEPFSSLKPKMRGFKEDVWGIEKMTPEEFRELFVKRRKEWKDD